MIAESRSSYADHLRESHYDAWRDSSAPAPNRLRSEDMFVTSSVAQYKADHAIEKRVGRNHRSEAGGDDAMDRRNAPSDDLPSTPALIDPSRQTTTADPDVPLAGATSASARRNPGEKHLSELVTDRRTADGYDNQTSTSETTMALNDLDQRDATAEQINRFAITTTGSTPLHELSHLPINNAESNEAVIERRRQLNIPLQPEQDANTPLTRLTERASSDVGDPVVISNAGRQRSSSFSGTPTAHTLLMRLALSQLARRDSMSADHRRRHRRRSSLSETVASQTEVVDRQTSTVEPLKPEARRSSITSADDETSPPSRDTPTTSPSIDFRNDDQSSSGHRANGRVNHDLPITTQTTRKQSYVVPASGQLDQVSTKPPVSTVHSAARTNEESSDSRRRITFNNEDVVDRDTTTEWQTSNGFGVKKVVFDIAGEQTVHHRHTSHRSRDGSHDPVTDRGDRHHHRRQRHRPRERDPREGSADELSGRDGKERNNSVDPNRSDRRSTFDDSDRSSSRRRQHRQGNDRDDVTDRRNEADVDNSRHHRPHRSRRRHNLSPASRRRDGVVQPRDRMANEDLHRVRKSIVKDKETPLSALVASYNAANVNRP